MNTYGVKLLAHRERKPEEGSINACLIAHNNTQSAITDQYRAIRNNIRFSSSSEELSTLVVTSSSEGEGKSTVAVNLAISFAQHGGRVLLVDANIRNPNLNHVFNLKLWPGLTDGLANHIDILETIHQSNIENLSVIPGGSSLPNAADLLDSWAMKTFLELARNRYDIIIFDCSSVLESPETIALARRCSGAILVVKSEKTQQKNALEAKRLLEFANVKIVGAVLNKKKK